ncbi:MAG: Gfo/Idh/MocA family oxidoreductase [Caldilineaceae bacterium]|nr:Gfo/Idh/MocA family oxidoreductase [Caldilineaceae bacterium]
MNNKIGIGVIGGGGISAEGHICGYQADQRCEVVALFDADEAKMNEQAQRLGVPHTYTNLDAFLAHPNLQAVSVCSPDHLHGEHCRAALQAGKHILCEKPMTTSREEAAQLVTIVRQSGLTFLGGHVYHFRPDYQAMANAYRNGEIGEVWLAEGDYISDMRPFYGPTGQTPWRTEGGTPQDILLGGGCHPLGLMLWAMQTTVTEVFAFANHKAEPTLPIDDCYVVSLKFANGAIGKLIAASGNRGYAPSGGHLVLYGTEGTLWGRRFYRNNVETHKAEVIHDWVEAFKDYKPRVHNTRQVHHWAEQCAHFLDCIEGKDTPMTSVEDGARVIATLTAALESVRTGQAIAVDNQF